MARELPPPSPFAGDDGAIDPRLAQALALAESAQRLPAIVSALAVVRLLVPVVAHLDERAEAKPGEIAGEKQASAAMVTLATADGRSAMPVFSGMAALHQWRPDARPIPVPGPQAALAAVTESEGLLVLDPGSAGVLIPRPAVWALGQGLDWVAPAQDAEVVDLIAQTLRGIEEVRDVRIEPLGDAGAKIVLGLPAGLRREQVDSIIARAGAKLAQCDLVASRVEAISFSVRAC